MRKIALGIAVATVVLVAAVAVSVPRGPMNHGWDWPWHDWWHSASARVWLDHDAQATPQLQPQTSGGVAASAPANAEKHGIIPHAPVLKTVLPDTSNLEVAVYETEYGPNGINPRHRHPAAITFYVVSGTGVWQEDGKPPVTLHAGDSLFVPAGTVHSHWNPSTSDHLRFLEFIVAEKDKGRSIPMGK